MSRLIDVSAVKARFLENAIVLRGEKQWLEALIDAVNTAPTVDAVPVVHGKWNRNRNELFSCRCSICNAWNNFQRAYCPNCGAKMEEST
jgi:hypothetical protein